MPSASSKRATGFGGWRRRRPFAAGLFMLLSGIVMVTPAYLSFEVSNIIIQVSTISGVSTLLIGALLATCAIMAWYKPEMRLLAGVAAMILGIVALPMSNLGGFIIGTLLALIGGALALSWTPEDKDRDGDVVYDSENPDDVAEQAEFEERAESEQSEQAEHSEHTEEASVDASAAAVPASSVAAEPVEPAETASLSDRLQHTDQHDTAALDPQPAADESETQVIPTVEETAEPKRRKPWSKLRRGSKTTVLALLVTMGTAAGVVTYDAPNAQAQIPLPQLPQLPGMPGQQPAQPGQGGQPSQQDTNQPQAPQVPGLPTLPQLPPPPSLQDLANSPQIPEDLRFDFSPPSPIPDELPVQDSMFEIKSDSTKLVGHVKFSLIQQPTTRGPEPALRIDADKAILDNLSVQFPGTPANNYVSRNQRSGPGQISTLTGNFHIIVRKLTVTPQVSGVTTFPITLDASMAPIELQKELSKVGLGQPEALASQLVMLNGVMDTYFVKADQLDLGPGTQIGD